MRNISFALIALFAFFLVLGCTQTTDKLLNGKWIGETDSNYSMTFLDGKVTVITPFNTETINYTADGSNLILNSGASNSQKVNYRFENNSLVITYGVGSAPNNNPSEIVETVYVREN